MSSTSIPAPPTKTNVLIIGGAYAGLSVVLNLIKICEKKDINFRKPSRGSREGRGIGLKKPFQPGDKSRDLKKLVLKSTPDITILDVRDGFCKSKLFIIMRSCDFG